MHHCRQWLSGSAAGGGFFGRRFEPRSGPHAGDAADGIDSNRRPQKQQPAALPFYCGLLQLIVHPHCLEPSAYKLLHHALGYAT